MIRIEAPGRRQHARATGASQFAPRTDFHVSTSCDHHHKDGITQGPLWKIRLITVLLVLAACSGTGPLPAIAAGLKPGTHAGTLQGAPCRIDIPADWNGDLVMLMHGYQPTGTPRSTPMKPAGATHVFLKQGYAVAQSNYASQGWAVGDAIVDNERLRQHFVRAFDRPAHTYIFGFSLGALETVAGIERYGHACSGALAICGATVSTPELISRAAVTPLVASMR